MSSSKGKRRERLTTSELLRYLVRPLHLPPFGTSPADFERSISKSINRLLIEAAEEGILPSKVSGVQFIFARRHKHLTAKRDEEVRGNYSYPLLLSCENHTDAIKIADGMAYVTDLLMRKGSSFHERVRKYGLTDSPAVCVFSASAFNGEVSPEDNSTNVLWITLPTDFFGDSQVRYLAEDLLDLDEQLGERYFYQADLNTIITEGRFAEELISVPGRVFAPRTRVLCASRTTVGFKKGQLSDLMRDLKNDSTYLRRVSYLLQFGDIILCTPHAYDTQPQFSEVMGKVHDAITDAGLTVILDRNKGELTKDDWMRVQVVAQKLAIFAGAAVSTATEARENIFKVLNDVFAHEFSNSSRKIVAYLSLLNAKNESLSSTTVSDVEGRLQFTQNLIDSAMGFYKGHNDTLGQLLGSLIEPMKKYHDACITGPDYGELSAYHVMSLWKLALAEALRNAYKHCIPSPEDGKFHIIVTYQVEGRFITVSIQNLAKREFVLDQNREGWALMQMVAHSTGGTITPSEQGGLFSVNVKMPLIRKGIRDA